MINRWQNYKIFLTCITVPCFFKFLFQQDVNNLEIKPPRHLGHKGSLRFFSKCIQGLLVPGWYILLPHIRFQQLASGRVFQPAKCLFLDLPHSFAGKVEHGADLVEGVTVRNPDAIKHIDDFTLLFSK